jgi:hypothetical protein
MGKSWWESGTKRILCASQWTVRKTAGTSPHPVCNYTNRRCSRPTQASHMANFSYPLLSSTWYSSVSPMTFFRIHYLTIIAEQKVTSTPLYLTAMIMSWHQVHYGQSPALTKISIHVRLFVFPSVSWFQVACQTSLQLPVYFPTLSTAISQVSMRAESYCHIVTCPWLQVK